MVFFIFAESPFSDDARVSDDVRLSDDSSLLRTDWGINDIFGFISPRDEDAFDGSVRRPAPKLVRID